MAAGTTNPVVPASALGPASPPAPASAPKNQNYKGFVAGVFSGIAKLSGSLLLPPSPLSRLTTC
jgi:hypothetical protein